jgi:hypothetical protein
MGELANAPKAGVTGTIFPMPMLQSTKLEFVINLQTAGALSIDGLSRLPAALADDVQALRPTTRDGDSPAPTSSWFRRFVAPAHGRYWPIATGRLFWADRR